MTQAHQHARRARSRRALGLVLALTAAYTVAEFVAGLLTGSLALLADAGHMLGDVGALGLALGAAWLASRPATPDRSFGFQRAEILAALVNGLVLVAIAIWIFIEAIGRLDDPPEILGGWMLLVALVGLAVNVVAASILARAAGESLNVQAALRHVFADLASSAGVAVAAIVILATGWEQADPLAGMAISLLILASSWSILRDSVVILLEATPSGIDAREVGRRMAAAEGVVEVHDLHIWTITSGFPALSAHVLVARGDDCHARRLELEQMLAGEFGLEHTTLQVEHVGEQRGLQIRPLRRRSS
jgi:cobalt-zinc-cadmium efflux system protein